VTVDLRTAAHAHDTLLLRRLDVVVPRVMARAGLDAWVLVAREYAEDPVLATMLPATWLATARRRTVLVFVRTAAGPDGTPVVERFAVARYPVGLAFPPVWDPTAEPDQWTCLARLLDEHDPATIGVDRSATFPLADGLTASEHEALLAALPRRLRERVVGAQAAAVGWLETRLPEEVDALRVACARAHGYLRRALSAEVLTPGVTTTADVEWWLRQAVHDDGLGSWFHPSCTVQRRGGTVRASVATADAARVVEPGDLVHVDFGIVDRGLCTDQQQHAYVLRSGESAPPSGVLTGLAAANRLQDLLMARFAVGVTGNELLASTLAAARAEGIDGLVYSHPIGVHGHAAGPTIGLWDAQDGVPGPGDHPLVPDTAYSVELQARVAVPEWDGEEVAVMLEEDAFFDGATCAFLDGRQTALHVIG